MSLLGSLALDANAQEQTARAVRQTQPEQEENWLLAQIRRFRSYPHLHLAYRLLDQGKLHEAANAMKTYLEINPQDTTVRIGYFSILYRQRNMDELLRQVDYVLARDPDNVKALLYRGLAHQMKGEVRAGLDSFRQVYMNQGAAREDRIFAASTAADMELANARYEAGLAALSVLMSLQDSASMHYRRGIALAGIGSVAEAEDAFETALERAASKHEKVQAQSALGYLAQSRGNKDKAMRYGEAVLALEPKNVGWLHTLANIYYSNKDYPQAENVARRVLGVSNALEDRLYLANILAERKNHAEAIEQYAVIAKNANIPDLTYRANMGLGYAYQAAGNLTAARQSFSRAAQIKPEREARAALAFTNLRIEPTGARATSKGNLRALLAEYRRYPSAHGAASIGYLYAQKSDHANAAAYMEEALRHASNPDWRLQLSLHYIALRQPDKALAELQAILGAKTRMDLQAQALRQIGYIHSQSGNVQPAIAAFQEAIAKGSDDPAVRNELGFLYAETKKYSQAIEQFLHVLQRVRTPRTMLGIARMYVAMKEPELALHYYRMAESSLAELDGKEQAALYAESGLLLAEIKQFEQAQQYLTKAAELDKTPQMQLNLAYVEEMRGMLKEALSRLDSTAPEARDKELKLRLFDQYARLHERAGNPGKASQYQEQALALRPSAERHYERAIHAIKMDRPDIARTHLHEAVRMAPQNNDYRLQLGYVCKNLGDSSCAIEMFDQVARQDSKDVLLQQDLAYTYAQAGDNDKAITWFKKAIDTQSEGNSTAGAHPRDGKEWEWTVADKANTEQKVYAMRQQVREMARRFQFNAYQSYRHNSRQPGNTVGPGFVTGGLIPSQGGVEFLYQPPGIGYRDGRTFRVFGRTLWSNRPESLRIDESTLQGGIGVEYKPLRDANVYLSLEKLVKFGSQSDNNWLVRASWGYSDGYGLKPNQSSWNQTIIYADAGYLLQHDNIRSVFAEVRQGRTYNFNNRILLTPHVTLAGRGQDPDPFDASYFEVGAGVSVKYLFNETRYEAARSSAELILQYRKAGTGNQEGGWMVTAALQF